MPNSRLRRVIHNMGLEVLAVYLGLILAVVVFIGNQLSGVGLRASYLKAVEVGFVFGIVAVILWAGQRLAVRQAYRRQERDQD